LSLMQPLEVPSMNVLPSRETSRRHLVTLVEQQHRLVRLEVPEMVRAAKRLGGSRRQLMAAVRHAEARLDFLNRVRSVLVTMPMESIRAWDIAPFEAEFTTLPTFSRAPANSSPMGPALCPNWTLAWPFSAIAPATVATAKLRRSTP